MLLNASQYYEFLSLKTIIGIYVLFKLRKIDMYNNILKNDNKLKFTIKLIISQLKLIIHLSLK